MQTNLWRKIVLLLKLIDSEWKHVHTADKDYKILSRKVSL